MTGMVTLAVVKACSVCADALVKAGGVLVEGEIRQGQACEWHEGPVSHATNIVEIERALLPARIVEEPLEPTEIGPVTELAARFLVRWIASGESVNPILVERAEEWARALLKHTKGA